MTFWREFATVIEGTVGAIKHPCFESSSGSAIFSGFRERSFPQFVHIRTAVRASENGPVARARPAR